MDKFTNLLAKQANGCFLEIYHKNELLATFEYFAGPVFVGKNYPNKEININVHDEFTPQQVRKILDQLKENYNVTIVGENTFKKRWR